MIRALLSADLHALSRRTWLRVATILGILAVALVVVTALNAEGADRADAYARGVVALFLLGGLALALTLGAPALRTEAENGTFAMLHAAGASRADLAIARLLGRIVALGVVLGLWALAAQAGSALIGDGLRADLAVHAMAAGLTALLAMMAAVVAGTILGPVAAGAAGAILFITAQGITNLKAAADVNLIGSGEQLIDAAWWSFPRTVTSPLADDLARRDVGGAAVTRFELNGAEAVVPEAGLDTWLWVAAWCGLLALVAYYGFRRRGF